MPYPFYIFFFNPSTIPAFVNLISKRIHEYTNGYPFLVCKICQILDTSEILKNRLSGEDSTWTQRGIDEAVGLLVKEPGISLFESLMGKLINYPDLKKQLCSILMDGERIEALPYDHAQEQLKMYGFVTEKDGSLIISNRVFEILLYNQFLGEDSRNSSVRQAADMDRNIFIKYRNIELLSKILECNIGDLFEIVSDPESLENN